MLITFLKTLSNKRQRIIFKLNYITLLSLYIYKILLLFKHEINNVIFKTTHLYEKKMLFHIDNVCYKILVQLRPKSIFVIKRVCDLTGYN